MSVPGTPITVIVNGRKWRLFDIEYETPDGKYSFNIYALSHEHACMLLEEIRQTAKVSGQVAGFYEP